MASTREKIRRFFYNKVTPVVATLSGAGLLWSLYLGWLWFPIKLEPPKPWPIEKMWEVAILIFWTLAPPVSFWAHYFFILDDGKITIVSELEKYKFERYKYGIDVSSKIWIALVSVLFVLYFGKDLNLK